MCAVLVQRSTFYGNRAKLQGGAVALGGSSKLTIQGCTFDSNSAAEQVIGSAAGGGALFALDNSMIALSDSVLTNNVGLMGGAVSLLNSAVLRLGQNVTAHRNRAIYTGGGFVTNGRNFDPKAAIRVFVNNTAKYDPNVGVPTERVTLLYPTGPVSLKSRLGASDGVTPAQVKLSGIYDLPSTFEVQALLNGAPFDSVMAGVDGVAHFRLKIKRPPGLYNVTFRPLDDGDIQPAYLLVNVTGCGLGDVEASSGDACITCVKGSYSMNPGNNTCDACPPNAGEPADLRQMQLCFMQAA